MAWWVEVWPRASSCRSVIPPPPACSLGQNSKPTMFYTTETNVFMQSLKVSPDLKPSSESSDPWMMETARGRRVAYQTFCFLTGNWSVGGCGVENPPSERG